MKIKTKNDLIYELECEKRYLKRAIPGDFIDCFVIIPIISIILAIVKSNKLILIIGIACSLLMCSITLISIWRAKKKIRKLLMILEKME